MNLRKYSKLLKPTPSTSPEMQGEINFIFKYWKEKSAPFQATLELNQYLQTKAISLERMFVEEEKASIRIKKVREKVRKETEDKREECMNIGGEIERIRKEIEEINVRYK